MGSSLSCVPGERRGEENYVGEPLPLDKECTRIICCFLSMILGVFGYVRASVRALGSRSFVFGL